MSARADGLFRALRRDRSCGACGARGSSSGAGVGGDQGSGERPRLLPQPAHRGVDVGAAQSPP